MLLFMYTLYITMLCLFKAQYVHYEGNNLQQKGDEYTVKPLLLPVVSTASIELFSRYSFLFFFSFFCFFFAFIS